MKMLMSFIVVMLIPLGIAAASDSCIEISL
jgi:hypothetical protein